MGIRERRYIRVVLKKPEFLKSPVFIYFCCTGNILEENNFEYESSVWTHYVRSFRSFVISWLAVSITVCSEGRKSCSLHSSQEAKIK